MPISHNEPACNFTTARLRLVFALLQGSPFQRIKTAGMLF
jgi:hypothetical protein